MSLGFGKDLLPVDKFVAVDEVIEFLPGFHQKICEKIDSSVNYHKQLEPLHPLVVNVGLFGVLNQFLSYLLCLYIYFLLDYNSEDSKNINEEDTNKKNPEFLKSLQEKIVSSQKL